MNGIIFYVDTTGDSGMIWSFPIMGVPQNGWFIGENPMKRHVLEVPQYRDSHPVFWWLIVTKKAISIVTNSGS